MGIRDTVIAFGTVSGATPGPAGGPAVSAVGLRLETLLASHPEATFYMRAEGATWADAGIGDGDILVVDRSAPPTEGAMVVAVIEGELALRRLVRAASGRLTTMPFNARSRATPVADAGETSLWGVVTWTIRKQ